MEIKEPGKQETPRKLDTFGKLLKDIPTKPKPTIEFPEFIRFPRWKKER